MDRFGRRALLLSTFPQMAWCLLAAGFCFLMPKENSAKVPLIAFFVYLFGAFYGPGKLCDWRLSTNLSLISYRNWSHPIHLLLRIIPTVSPRNRSRFYDLRQQCRQQRSWSDIPVSSGKGHSNRCFLLVCRAQHAVLYGHLFRGSGDKTTYA